MPRIQQLLAPTAISYGSNDPRYIVVHYTATNASAYNNAVYFSRGGNGGSSAHYFVDGGDVVYQSVPDWRGAWHGGNYECNTHSIGIEVVSAGQDFTAAEVANLKWLVMKLMGDHGITKDRVIRHFDVADVFGGYTLDPHKHCPAPYVDDGKWAALKEEITMGNPKQEPGNPVNANGVRYQAHVQNLGWCDQVRDGQTAGTTGYGMRLEAFKVDAPGVKMDVKAHIQGEGWKTFANVAKDTVIGTVGKSLRLEAFELDVKENATGKKLKYRAHIQNRGWTDWAFAPYPVGTMGEGLRIEAVQMVLE